MIRKYAINSTLEGPFGQVLRAIPRSDAPTLEELLQTVGELAFIVETVAHLQGKERELLPTADKARKQIAALQTHEVVEGDTL